MPSSCLRMVLHLISLLLALAPLQAQAFPAEQCDEIMCRSPGLYGGYGCWALMDGNIPSDVHLCAEGNVAVPMENVPHAALPDMGTFFYYTCCPSDTNIATIPAETEPFCAPYWDGFCGDLLGDCIADVPGEPMVCLDDIYKYPHKTGSTFLSELQYYSQYRCCKDPPKAIQSTEASPAEQCDEIMCRSPGLYGGYGCWALMYGNIPSDVHLCAEGYVAVPMENVPHAALPDLGTFFYYTCCPSDTNIATIPAETEPFCAPYWDGFCGDLLGDCIADVPGEPMVCLDDIYKYPHKTGSTILSELQYYSQYRCCKDPPKAIQSTKTSSAEQCDELMCRSPGLYGGYSCWALVDGNIPSDVHLCAEGYVAVPMENVPHAAFPDMEGTFFYYTCCPSDTNIATIPAETEPFCAPYWDGFCGDIFGGDCFGGGPGEPMACLDDIYKYPHKTGSTSLSELQYYSQYRCCKDPPKAIQSAEALCAPYWDGFCGDGDGDCIADGPGEPMVCLDDIYKYPNKTGFKVLLKSWWLSEYRCCKNPPENPHSSIFVPEIFRLVFGIISALFTSTIVAGILLSRGARKQSFNLYVVSATLGELIYSLVSILIGSFTTSKNILPKTCEAITASLAFAFISDLWMSAITIREVLIILLSSKQALRTSPPPLRKVLVQVISVYFLAAGIAWLNSMFSCNSSFDTGPRSVVATLIASTTPPIIYATYACIRVWKQQLLPKTGRTRFLYIYFLRLASITVMGLPLVGLVLAELYNIIVGGNYILLFAFSIRGWINFCFILTKPDIRQTSIMLWTCRCFSDDVASERVSWFGHSLTSLLSSRISSRFRSTELQYESSNLANQKEKEPTEQNKTNHIDTVGVSLKDNKEDDIDTVGVSLKDNKKDDFYDNENDKNNDFLDRPEDSSRACELSSNFL